MELVVGGCEWNKEGEVSWLVGLVGVNKEATEDDLDRPCCAAHRCCCRVTGTVTDGLTEVQYYFTDFWANLMSAE